MGAVRLVVRAKPGVRTAGIALANDVVVVSVREKAVNGDATAAVLLAVWLGVPVRNVVLVRGASSRVKQLAVSSVSEAFVAEAVAALSRGPSTSSG